TGPFAFEATIPTVLDMEGPPPAGASSTTEYGPVTTDFRERMLEVLRKSPVLRLEGNKTVTFQNVRPPAKSLSLSAEALVDASAPGQSPTLAELAQESLEKSGHALPFTPKPVAFVFGPENGAVSERPV